MFFRDQAMLIERRIWEMFVVCCVKENLRFRHFLFHHAKNAQRTITRSKRNAWSESKATTFRETIETLEKRKGKLDIEKMKHHKLFKEKRVAKYFSFHHFFWCNVEAILIFELWLKFFRYRFSRCRFKWKSWNARRQFVKFCRDSHVFFEVKYFFHFTKYCWPRCRKIRSISYFWFFCN